MTESESDKEFETAIDTFLKEVATKEQYSFENKDMYYFNSGMKKVKEKLKKYL